MIMNESLLTHQIITGCIAGTDGGQQNHKIVTILGIVMFLLGGIGFWYPIVAVICWGIALLCLVLIGKSKRIIRSVLRKEYVLREDVCTNKRVSASTEGPDTKYLVCQKSGQVAVNFPYAILNSQAFRKTPDLYQDTEIGDTVYLLCTSKGYVLYVFNQRFWKINEEEFTQKDDLFTPA
jgi:hypothetical protein